MTRPGYTEDGVCEECGKGYPHKPDCRTGQTPAWAPGGAFCDCGLVEFMVPGPACCRTAKPGMAPTQHTPTECRPSTYDEVVNLIPPEETEDA
jgi:hypothetical protein